MFLEIKAQPVRKVDITAICELVVHRMWDRSFCILYRLYLKHYVLWHVDPLLGKNTTAVTMQRIRKLQQRYDTFCAVYSEMI
jgi:hypothetical protein